ncbi:MAG: leucine-rich repeat protein, partial [Oscillospiraceae bacterium]|nr:leucine-rich repeat protein [Oscillospiraceae bacterium]
IPDSVTIIKASTFNYCESLKSILIPNSVTIIEDWAFSYCFALESITIPNSVTTIGESAFCGCSALKSITIPNSVTSIKFLAFDCKNLETIKIENPECEIEDYENCTIFDRATIYGYDNSTAQAYAEKYDREFVSLGEAPVYEIGDINRDGAINVTDIIYLQKYLHGKQNISQRQYALADMNQDNMINIFDFVLLKNKILNKK